MVLREHDILTLLTKLSRYESECALFEKKPLFLWKDAKVVLTDSGGLQEETTALGVPCVTIRENTERPITVEMGTNVLAGTSRDGILSAVRESLIKAKTASIPPLWDGKAAERIWARLTHPAG